MSYDERVVLAFSEEAYWDLEATKHLLQFIDLRLCGTDPKVFYLGRRVRAPTAKAQFHEA